MKKIIEFICFVVGPTIVAFSLVNFSSMPYYYYSDGSKTGVAMGVFLICLGFFLKSQWMTDNKGD